jgi:hypothetical protein
VPKLSENNGRHLVNPALLVFAVLFGLLAWREAARFEKRYGRTPWGWHPSVWALVCFLSILIGVVLLAIAERAGRNEAAKQAVFAAQPWAPPPGYVTPPFGDVSFAQPAEPAGRAPTPPPMPGNAGYGPPPPTN